MLHLCRTTFMKTLLFILLLFAYRASAQQQVPLLTIDQLNSRLASGRDTTYIINFWATWCVPCLKELPAFEKLYETNKTDKLKILLVSVDVIPVGSRSLPRFIKKRKLQNEVWLLNEKHDQSFIDRVDSTWSGAIPATLLVKKEKRRFFEKDFTYPELLTEYHNIQ
jgi:thiol-disulfide isomerase/thioredoxin